MKVVFAGTFDPITKGHEDIIKRLCKKFGTCLVVVGQNPNKTPLFTEDERVDFIKETFSDNKNVEVVKYSDYKQEYFNFLQSNNVKYYARGIRNRKDLKYEREYKKQNKILYPFVKTVFIKSKKYKEVSSTLIKQKLSRGEEILTLAPQTVANKITKTYLQKLEK